jgi:SAM-dependent methyltransferase
MADRDSQASPPGPNTTTWSRVVMNSACRELLAKLDYAGFDTLEISGRAWQAFGFARYRTVEFPAFDVCAGPLDERFDLIIAEQVFEHLLYPYRAGRNVHAMLRPGGWFLISVPFLVKVHAYPIDCTRWTALGLRHFLHECGFPLEQIEAGAWGNRDCVIANFDRWVAYEPDAHDLRNEPDFPYHVWALAQRGP